MWVQLFVEGAQQLVKLKCLLQFEEKMFSCVDHQEREREGGSGEKRWRVVDDDMVDRVGLKGWGLSYCPSSLVTKRGT